jgi:hypothetical protein
MPEQRNVNLTLLLNSRLFSQVERKMLIYAAEGILNK